MSKRKERWQERKERFARERVERAENRRRMTAAGAIIAVLLVAGVAIYLALRSDGGGEGYAPATPIDSNTPDTKMTIPVSEIGAEAKFYTYDSGGTTVRFFAVKGPDGEPHIAADACDVCYGNKRGYRQAGNDMKCNNCGQTFAINGIGTKNTAGGCWPSYIPISNDDTNVQIAKSDLDGKAYMFR